MLWRYPPLEQYEKHKIQKILKLQKQVDKLLEEYRREEVPQYKEPEGEPSY